MKSILSLAVAFFALSLSAQEFKFEKETIDYGKIVQNVPQTRVFKFTNIGDEPIIIKKVKTSCGCTAPSFSKAPVPKGETGEIKIRYNASSLKNFSKVITIFSNAKNERKVLKIKGYVQPAKKEAVKN